MNANFCNDEFFDRNLFTVFRKDRDSTATDTSRGGGVLVAVKSGISAAVVTLKKADSQLDQLCVSIDGDRAKLIIFVSYIPPNGSEKLYRDHVDNVLDLSLANKEAQFCILGDYNLSKIIWSCLLDDTVLIPSNVYCPSEIYLIDGFFSLELDKLITL
ncbi:uncharacterized protein LOC118751668 [Rhagoletis pomonella]|uniref:uncharacterized protein LOC118751668 n=1 Tax=Rhagoletis pomonella TaxID=28610 RepID=UPI00177CB85F|nr:uncharacterized protein LOC118751668 [Rhagoletis pomonella]